MITQPRFLCVICGQSIELETDFCVVNLHEYGDLSPDEMKTGCVGWLQKGAAHHSCLQGRLVVSEEDPDRCAVCLEIIAPSSSNHAMKLAVYTDHEERLRGDRRPASLLLLTH